MANVKLLSKKEYEAVQVIKNYLAETDLWDLNVRDVDDVKAWIRGSLATTDNILIKTAFVAVIVSGEVSICSSGGVRFNLPATKCVAENWEYAKKVIRRRRKLEVIVEDNGEYISYDVYTKKKEIVRWEEVA